MPKYNFQGSIRHINHLALDQTQTQPQIAAKYLLSFTKAMAMKRKLCIFISLFVLKTHKMENNDRVKASVTQEKKYKNNGIICHYSRESGVMAM